MSEEEKILTLDGYLKLLKELQAARRVCELVQRKVNTDDWEEDNAKRQENLQNEHELLKALEAYKQVRGE